MIIVNSSEKSLTQNKRRRPESSHATTARKCFKMRIDNSLAPFAVQLDNYKRNPIQPRPPRFIVSIS